MSSSPVVAGTDARAARGRALPMPVTALIDLAAITVFVLIGRSSHDEGLTVIGVLQTLWPFAVGAAAGWSIAYVFSHVRSSEWFGHDFRPERLAPSGVMIWFCAVAVAMILRYLLHQGVAPSFVIVATITLGVFLLGWRATYGVVVRRRSTSSRAG
ncbi:DUF3054 family protein [Gordonia sp. HNM0687]|uniref:DUF3054 family protein n=1 Tax=Gordonia mangrovi TaxID=2665643 RepID=A0A6L7GQK1_9ACTN|nr:DUF3054 domain-containing protein [Gordonia mangrovi]MXP21912.1 DUF3054 family protein [Gordonia mangrovi]UVF76277.1 DUF3054 domain-containing protein [Gordonia mangrovi]